jgi:hypothetical protein
MVTSQIGSDTNTGASVAVQCLAHKPDDMTTVRQRQYERQDHATNQARCTTVKLSCQRRVLL